MSKITWTASVGHAFLSQYLVQASILMEELSYLSIYTLILVIVSLSYKGRLNISMIKVKQKLHLTLVSQTLDTS